jgi:hypothetical protein
LTIWTVYLEYFSRLFFKSYFEDDPSAFWQSHLKVWVKVSSKHYFYFSHTLILFRSLNSVFWLFEQCFFEYLSRSFFKSYFEADPSAFWQSHLKVWVIVSSKHYFYFSHILILFRSLNSVFWLFEQCFLEYFHACSFNNTLKPLRSLYSWQSHLKIWVKVQVNIILFQSHFDTFQMI